MLPVITETDWLLQLKALPVWHPPKTSTVVLSPHPDDETLGVGGLISDLQKQNIDIRIVAVTDGENAYSGWDGLGIKRQQEQACALGKLGISDNQIVRLHISDSSVAESELLLEQELHRIIDSQVHVIAPWTGDFHPDHESVGRVATKVAQLHKARLTYYFFWLWHQGTLKSIEKLPLHIYPISPATLKAKLAALSCHQSQLEHPSGLPILPEALLAPTRRPFEVFLPYV